MTSIHIDSAIKLSANALFHQHLFLFFINKHRNPQILRLNT